MAEIEEIPVDSEEIMENIQENIQETINNDEEIPPAPKKKGRPPGSRNRIKEEEPPKETPKAKPRPKAKAPKPKKKVEEEEEEEEPPPRRRRVQQVPVEVDRHALAADVLNLLQQQKHNRSAQKRALYASWFENM